MAISTDFVTLQRQVADELGDRLDLLTPLSDSALSFSPIQNAIWSAIAKWERQPFYFNEVYGAANFVTVSGQEFYTSADSSLIASAPQLSKLNAIVSANRQPLTLRSWEYLDGMSTNPQATGSPSDFSYFARQMRLYPVPDAAYTINVSATQRVAALSADSDANVWTQDGFDLIKAEAKLILAREVLGDDEMAARMEAAINGPGGYLSALRGETTRRGRSRIKPTRF